MPMGEGPSARVGCWGDLWPVPLPPHVSSGLHHSGKALVAVHSQSWNGRLCMTQKRNEEVRAAVLKAVQRGFGCLVLI